MKRPGLMALTVLAASVLGGSSASAQPARPTIGPPDPTGIVATITGPGARGGAFMDYTDDAAMQVTSLVIGLSARATYRLVGTTTPCATPYRPADRIFGRFFATAADGSGWIAGASTARGSTALVGAVRILKGASGANQVGCGRPHQLVQAEHPLATIPVHVSRWVGAGPKGLVIARDKGDGRIDLTVVLRGVTQDEGVRFRGASLACSDPWSGTHALLRPDVIPVSDRHQAFRKGGAQLEHGAKLNDIDSYWLGPRSGPYAPTVCKGREGWIEIQA